MKGGAWLIVGAPGMGKTNFTQSKVRLVHSTALYINDVNAEYTEFFQGEFIEDFEEAAKHMATLTQSLIVAEEATAFLSNKGGNKWIKKMLVSKRHKQNLIFLVFHSLRGIPREIYDLCNCVVLFKTADDETLVRTRFDNPKLTEAFLELKKADLIPNPDPSKDPYSPHKIISING